MKKGLLRCEVIIKSNRLKYLPELMRKKGVSALKIKEVNSLTQSVTVDFADKRKFFAICKNMCYNIQKIKYKGLLSLFANVTINFGVVLGAIAFILLAVYLDGFMFKVDCVGSGACFSSEITATLSKIGVKKGVRFDSLDYNKLQSGILASNKRLSFVTIKKRGNRLVVNSVLASEEFAVSDKNTKDLLCKNNGVIENISVLRGTAIVNVGDAVNKGDVLVGAYATGKEGETYSTYIVARVTVLSTVTREFIGENTPEFISYCKQIAEFEEAGEVIDKSAVYKGDKCVVTLTVRYYQ